MYNVYTYRGQHLAERSAFHLARYKGRTSFSWTVLLSHKVVSISKERIQHSTLVSLLGVSVCTDAGSMR